MQPQTVNLDGIKDVNTLKVMAYDQMVVKEQAERNLNNINQRLAQIVSEALPNAAPDPGDTAPTTDAAENASETTDEQADENS